MARLTKHLGLVKHLGDFRFKRWLDKHALEVLEEVGIGSGQAVLDFGCGAGTYTIPAAKLVGRSGKVYALDVSKKSLDRMEEKSQQEGLSNVVRIDVSAGEKVPLGDDAIDQMMLIDVLQEIDDKESLINEAFRILKTDGVLSVFPMHLDGEKVIKLITDRGFDLKNREFDGHILVFKKSMQIQQ